VKVTWQQIAKSSKKIMGDETTDGRSLIYKMKGGIPEPVF